jgi:hypothetical protein
VVKYVEEVVAIAEQTASGTQQVASTAKQLSGSMQELTASSQQLNDIADDLQEGISAFKLLNGSYIPQGKTIRRMSAMPGRSQAYRAPDKAPETRVAPPLPAVKALANAARKMNAATTPPPAPEPDEPKKPAARKPNNKAK